MNLIVLGVQMLYLKTTPTVLSFINFVFYLFKILEIYVSDQLFRNTFFLNAFYAIVFPAHTFLSSRNNFVLHLQQYNNLQQYNVTSNLKYTHYQIKLKIYSDVNSSFQVFKVRSLFVEHIVT